ncbi:MAG: zf-TFIIB domain-containing protein [Bdellovibrionales bacterium]|nr:zf-TFIIB domain-containing protein [Bdellovibrionales bacterium]
MSSDSWDNMRKAKEESYFEKRNREALERLRRKKEEEAPRPSPITGKPMVQEVLSGVVIDRCPDSGGVWLDAGELEALLEAAKSEDTSSAGIVEFFRSVTGRK